MRNVKDYGACGDGKTLDTEALQRAINDGGTVYVPEGTYITGTLYLKSNGGLYLDSGAVLKASRRRCDYNADDFCVQNAVFASEKVTGAHLITAVEQENVTIEGHGTIDGQGDFWMNESNVQPGWPNKNDTDYCANPERPGQMIFFCECRNVRVSGVNIINAPYWHLFFHGCEEVFANGLNIHGDRPRWTNDGIDIDCCQKVTVSGCIIDVGDDGITLRGYDKPLKKKRVCENVAVSNCVVHSHRDYGIRIGVGAGTVRNCTFSNMTVEAPNLGGIGIFGRWSNESKSASTVENILMSNISVKAHTPIEIRSANGDNPLPNKFHIKNISMNSIMLSGESPSVIYGFPEERIQNVFLNGVTVADGPSDAFDIKLCDGVKIENMNIVSDGSTENAVSVSDSTEVSVNGEKLA